MNAKRIASGITAAQLARHALEVSTTDRPEPPANSVTYRCGASIYRHKADWRTACQKTKAPHASCACNQQPALIESEAAA